MNRAWASSVSNFFHSASLSTSLTVLVAAIIVIGLASTLFRSDGSISKLVLSLIALVVIGTGVTVAMLRGPVGEVQPQSASVLSAPPPASVSPPVPPQSAAPPSSSVIADRRPAVPPGDLSIFASMTASLPALSCLDGLAGESVEAACEKALFASADSTAAAVSYAAAQITRLASFGTVAAADKAMTPELGALRRAIERDRFGLIAQVLTTREGCTSTACPFFQSLTDTARISSNMNERLYDGVVGKYTAAWYAPPASAAPAAAPPTPGVPTGRPVSGDFPSASSIPPVNIMSPEPTGQGTQVAPPRAPENAAATRAPPAAGAKKTTAQKSRAQAPTSLAPAQPDDDN